jgi:hypothetical protein
MNDIDWLQIIKWVVIVLLAGFIGQFGKSLAKHLMEKARARKEKFATGRSESEISQISEEKRGEADFLQLQSSILTPQEPKEESKQKKKAAKALVKQRKKETKGLEKGKE